MKKILITGATGNVGLAIIKHLPPSSNEFKCFAGVRDLAKDSKILKPFNVTPILFDFLNIDTQKAALAQCDILFLLRPPQLSDVNAIFKPIIDLALANKVQQIVFLSVQGVEKSTIIPHHKIEKLIIESGIPYTFLRPAYFMQNFTTTLKNDIVANQRIFLPVGNAKFTLIDVDDIAKVAVKVLLNPLQFHHQALELTNNEQLNFKEMAEIISTGIGRKIAFVSPNLLWFYWQKKKENMPFMLIMVMIMLHYFPRFQPTPAISDEVKKITGAEPKSLAEFVEANKSEFLPSVE